MKCKPWIALLSLFFLANCGLIENLPDEDELFAGSLTNEPVIESTQTFYLAMGGVAPGRDELVIYDSNNRIRSFRNQDLTFRAEPDDVIGFETRDDKASFSLGSGAKLLPLKTGTTTIYYSIDGIEAEETFKVIVPPQTLIQILLGEARGEIVKELTLSDAGAVALSSSSPTAEMIGWVINNRILEILLDANPNPALFSASSSSFELNTPQSYYDAIIEAPNQFNPTFDGTSSQQIYEAAAEREELSQTYQAAYDQVVLTASNLFEAFLEAATTGDRSKDPTGGAFAFRSPNNSQWDTIQEALSEKALDLPDDIGVSDDNFPAFSPSQILVHPDIYTNKESKNRPSFILTRARCQEDKNNCTDPAITNIP